jgi:hypothetical protein
LRFGLVVITRAFAGWSVRFDDENAPDEPLGPALGVFWQPFVGL